MRSTTPVSWAFRVLLVFACTAAAPPTVLAALSDGLVAYWSFDEDFTATEGGAQFDAEPSSDPPGVHVHGRFGSSAYFIDTNGEYLDVDAPVITQGQDHSYSVWYRSTEGELSGTARHFVLETRDAAGTNGFSVSYGLRDGCSDTCADIGQVISESESGTIHGLDLEDATVGWHNLIVTYDADNTGAEHTVYLDGVLAGTFASGPLLKDTAGLVIGSYRARNDRFWHGWIDDVAFWNRVLTTEEIAAIQSAPVLRFVDIGAGLTGVY